MLLLRLFSERLKTVLLFNDNEIFYNRVEFRRWLCFPTMLRPVFVSLNT